MKKKMALLVASVMAFSLLAGCQGGGAGQSGGGAGASGAASAQGASGAQGQESAAAGDAVQAQEPEQELGQGQASESEAAGDPERAPDQEQEPERDPGSAPAGEPEHIVVTFVYATVEPKDLKKVEAAVNEITIPAKNIEVEFRPISLADSFSNYSLWISSGESVDLMCLLAQDIRQYVTSGQLEPLDGYIGEDKTPTLSKLMREFNITGVVQGQIYGLSSVFPNYGMQPGMIVRKEWLDETGFPQKDIYAMEDVTAVFASIKANHPDCYPFTPLINGIANGGTAIATFTDVAVIGSHAAAGALMDKDSETVANLFETEEYREYLALLGEWYEAGYIMPDAATTDLSGGELLKNGRVAAFANEMSPQQFGAEGYGFELAGMPTDEPFMSGVSGIYFGVPITARHPEAAVRFWDCQLENHDLLNLILRGIEGEHWVMADEAEGFIDYPEGMDATNTPYLNLFGVWGDRRYEYNFNHDVTREATSAYTEAAMKNKWKSDGFSFDNTPITNELLSCQSVLDQYQKALETGVLGKNWEDTYDRMRAELQTAGTSAAIAECQRQLDEFLGK